MSKLSNWKNMKKRICEKTFSIVFLLIVGCGCCSCVSIEHAADSEKDLRIYGGTANSWNYINDRFSPFSGTIFRLIDLPMTLAMDTLILPISIPAGSSQQKEAIVSKGGCQRRIVTASLHDKICHRSNCASKSIPDRGKSTSRTKSQDSLAPCSLSMRESSHSTERGPE